MQRLRYIKQLGCASYVFPSANHTRFEHSLGVYFITCKIIEKIQSEIKKNYRDQISDSEFKELKKAMKAAALLHDIGQTPFSHDLEPYLYDFFLEKIENDDLEDAAAHELLSKLIIQKSDRISEIFNEHSIDKELVGNFITGKQLENYEYIFAQKVINGDIDADKIDYLLRDAYFTGVPFGNIDYNRILDMFTIWDDGQALQLAGIKKGYNAFESLVISRFQMYTSVYNHHTNRVVSTMMLYAFTECLKDEEKKDPSWLLYNIDDSIVSRIGSRDGNKLREIAPKKLGIQILFRNLYKRFLKTNEEILIKNVKIKNLMNRHKPFLYNNQFKIINEIGEELSNKNIITRTESLNHNIPYILIDIQKEKYFKDLNFVLIDPKDPDMEEVPHLKYIGRFLRHIKTDKPIIPWISYAFIQNKVNNRINREIEMSVKNYFNDNLGHEFWE
ncbi:MAG: HD domain-containing protein [Candidatus Lokiarchaeota archaeon]|nr:HD domain-containing protein [Candidatus Lokiarchaeota archaeon]